VRSIRVATSADDAEQLLSDGSVQLDSPDLDIPMGTT